MKRLSTRERLYLGIFVVALIWGAWNYRHLLFKPSPPEMAKVVNTSDAATPAPHVRELRARAARLRRLLLLRRLRLSVRRPQVSRSRPRG